MTMARSLAILIGFLLARSAVLAEDAPESLELGPRAGHAIVLDGPDAQAQVLATHVHAGRRVDVTRTARFAVAPPHLATVDATGVLQPQANGQGTITARLGNLTAQIPVRIENFETARPVHFRNQIVPIFTRHGCNGGGCHGKSSGQNGFRLSLLGFYPDDDYEYIVKDNMGRRLFPPAPELSLLLTKPTGESPHGGGKRLDRDSHEYRLLRRWIEQGMPRGGDDDPVVTRIECHPDRQVMEQNTEQQIAVHAIFSDGRRVDVTRMCLFEPNVPSLASVTETGLVRTADRAGEVAVMARYQGQVSTFRAIVPLGAPVKSLPPSRNVIDEAVFAQLEHLGIPPSAVCDDATFLRRVTLDITGNLPSAAEVTSFLADDSPGKRQALIDRLLASPDYADYFANKWNLVLRNHRSQDSDRAGTYAFHQWIWDALYDNKPYDEFVRDILTASGGFNVDPAVVWYREVSSVEEQVEDVAQLFLGVRIQCARCHHHPFERWSQNDYYSLAAFFSRVGRKAPAAGAPKNSRDRRIFHNVGTAQAVNPRTGTPVRPAGLGGETLQIEPEQDPRFALADWMAQPDNPFFATALVNRYWKHFFSRGIVEPEDDMRATNPPSNPELLSALSREFIKSGYDLKQLIRLICSSSTYQLSSRPNEFNLHDVQNFSRYSPKRLTAESLFDAFHQVTATPPQLTGVPAGEGALAMPDVTGGPYFLTVFGQPDAETACECERSQEANLAQSLHMINSTEVQKTLSSDSGRAAQLASQTERPHPERIAELYRWVYARPPTEDELQTALDYIQRHHDHVRMAYEDMLWALLNTKEFLFNH